MLHLQKGDKICITVLCNTSASEKIYMDKSNEKKTNFFFFLPWSEILC